MNDVNEEVPLATIGIASNLEIIPASRPAKIVNFLSVDVAESISVYHVSNDLVSPSPITPSPLRSISNKTWSCLPLKPYSQQEAKSDLQKQVEEKQNNMNNIIDEIAKMIIEENEPYIGKKVKDKAIEKLEKNTKEGGNENGESQKTRGRKKSTTI